MKSVLKIDFLNENIGLANLKFKILQFKNSLKIENFKLKIGDSLKNVVKTDAVFIYKKDLI